MSEKPPAARVFLEQAERCRRLARLITDQQVAQTLLDLADEFEKRAARVEYCLDNRHE